MANIDHNKKHDIDDTAAHTGVSGATQDNLTSFDANGLPKDSGIAASAVGTDSDAIHDNIAAEINAITEKASPVSADLLIIEDSAASNAKKKVQIGNLPSGGGETNTASNVGTAGVGVFKQKTGVDLEFKKINAGSSKVTITDDTGNSELDIDVVEANINIDNIADGTSFKKMTAAERTKLSGIETAADVTDTANVTAAGAVMDSELIDTSAGVGDAGKPIKLDAGGQVDATMINDADVSHLNITGIGTNSHAQVDTHIANTSNPHSVTKAQVGLTNVTDDAQLKRADGDLNSFAEKTTVVDADIVVIEDSAATYAKKKTLFSTIWTYISGKVSALYATKELDNLGTTAINADLLPSGDNLRDLGTSANKFKMINSVDLTFEESLFSDDITVQDITKHQFNLMDEIAPVKFNVTKSVATSTLTLTLTQPAANNLEFIADARMLQHTGSTMTFDATALVGTDAIPNKVYAYIENNAGAPLFTASNTLPDGVLEHVDASYMVMGAVSVSSVNIYSARNTKAYAYEGIEKIFDALVSFGCRYKSGMALTATASSFAVATGESYHGVRTAAMSARTLDGVTDNQYQIKNDGSYVTYSNFTIPEYYDAVAITANMYIRCVIGTVIDAPELNSSRFHIIPQSGTAEYDKNKDAWSDKKNMGHYKPRDSLVAESFQPLAIIVVFYNGTTYTLAQNPDTLLYCADIREGNVTVGGGTGAVSQNLYEIVTGDTGTTTASIPNDSLAIVGGAGITTTVTNDNVSIAGDAASATAAGLVELATIAETDTGTDALRAVTPDGLAGSVHGEVGVQVIAFDFTTDVATGNGKQYFHIPSKMNGMDLVEVHAEVITAGTTGTTDIQIANVTQVVDMLTTKITIDSGETGSDTAAAPPVIDTANDDVATNDLIRVDVDVVSTTAPKGLIVTLIFRLP